MPRNARTLITNTNTTSNPRQRKKQSESQSQQELSDQSDTDKQQQQKQQQKQSQSTLPKNKQIFLNNILNRSQVFIVEHNNLINQIINFIKENNKDLNTLELIKKHLIESLKKVLTISNSDEVDNFFKFLIDFSIVYYNYQKSQLGDLIDNNNNKEEYKSFLYLLVENILKFSQVSDYGIRSRSIYFFNLIIHNKKILPLLDDERIKFILNFLKNKTNDKNNIKCYSIKSILKIIKFLELKQEQEEEINGNNREIIKNYLNFIISMLNTDESNEVRKTILQNLIITKENYSIFITRLVDKCEFISKYVATLISMKLNPLELKKEDIETIVLTGLESRYQSTKKEITLMICSKWMKTYFNNDLESIIQFLYEKQKHDESIIKKIIFTLFNDGQFPNNKYLFKNSILSLKPMTDEFSLLFKLFFEFILLNEQNKLSTSSSLSQTSSSSSQFSANDDFQLDQYLPPISNYLNYFKNVDEFKGCLIFEILEKEREKQQQQQQQSNLKLINQPFVFYQLILILNYYSNEVKIALFKTYHVEKYFIEILKSLKYSIELKDIIIDLLRNSLNSKYFYDSLMNCISRLLAKPIITDSDYNEIKIQCQLHSLSIISNILKNTNKKQEEENIIYLIGYINELLDSGENEKVKEKALECYGFYCLLDSIGGNYSSKLFNVLLNSSNISMKSKMLSYCFDILLLKYQYLDIDNCIDIKENCFDKEISKLLFLFSESIINSQFVLEKQLKEIYIEGISKLFLSNIIDTSNIFYSIMVYFFKKDKDSENSYQILNQFFKIFPTSSSKSFNLFLKSFKPTINYFLFSNGIPNPKIIETIVYFYQNTLDKFQNNPKYKLNFDFKNKLLKNYLKSLIIYLKVNEKNQINLFSNILNKFDVQEIDSIDFKKIRAFLFILDDIQIKKTLKTHIQTIKNMMDYSIQTFNGYQDFNAQEIEKIREKIDEICQQRLEELEKLSFEAITNSQQDPFYYIQQIKDDEDIIDGDDEDDNDKDVSGVQLENNQNKLPTTINNQQQPQQQYNKTIISTENINNHDNINLSQTSNSSSLFNNYNSDIDINEINYDNDADLEDEEIQDDQDDNKDNFGDIQNNNDNNKNKNKSCIVM